MLHRSRPQPAKRDRRCRLQVEGLESRTNPAIFDLTADGSSQIINGAPFGNTSLQSTGNKATFLDLQETKTSNGIEQGYNTGAPGAPQFPTTLSGSALLLANVPRVELDGVIYREVVLDVSQAGGKIILNDLRIFASSSSTLTGYDETTNQLNGLPPVYDMDAGGDNSVLAGGTGTGKADLLVWIPESVFGSADPNSTYVYLYSKLGDLTPLPPGFPDRTDYAANDGSDHWQRGVGGPVVASADLAVTKTDLLTTVVPGQTVTYTITVTNFGPTTVNEILLQDTPPSQFQPGATFTPSSGSYNAATGLWTGLTLAQNQSVTMTFTGTISSSAAAGQLINTVTVSPTALIGDPVTGNNTATDEDTIVVNADLAVSKTDGKTSAVPGSVNTYTITVTNNGPTTVSSVTLTDTIPATLLNPVFGTPSAGSYDAATGVWSGLALAQGQGVTITLSGTIDPNASGTIVNSVVVAPPTGVTDPVSGNNSASDSDTLTPQVDVGVTKTDGVTTLVPGTSTTYTVVVSNTGPSTAIDINVSDSLPIGVTSFSWSGTNGHSGTGPINDLIASLAKGDTVTYTILAAVSPGAIGSLSNTVTVSAANDTIANNNSATDVDALTPHVDVGVSKNDFVASVVPGTSTTYTIVVTNTGASTATNIAVSDPLPPGVASFNWTGSNGSSGSGALNDTIASLAPGGSVTYTLTAAISPSATGTVANTVTVTAANDTNSANNTATDSDTLTPQVDVGVTKTDNVTSVVPGANTTYTIVVANTGLSTATNVSVNDPVPTFVTSFAWSGSNGSSGSGALSDIIASLVPGASVTYTVTAAIDPAAAASIVNTVTVAATNDTNTNNNSATDTDTLNPQVDLTVAKSDGLTSVVPGTPNSYTITVTNNGPSTVTSFTLTDTIPGALLSPVFGTPSSGTYNSGTGVWSGISLAKGHSVSITLSGTIDPTATGSITNRVVVAPPAGVTETDSDNNEAVDLDVLSPVANLAVGKTDGATTAVPGTPITYTITVSNLGPSTITSVELVDTLPVKLLSPTFGTPSQGSYDSTTHIWSGLNLATGNTVTITLSGTIDPAATGNITNIATVAPPAGVSDSDLSNNFATDTDTLTVMADVVVSKDDGKITVVPGTSTTYTIKVTNLGSSNLTSFNMVDTVPPQLDPATVSFGTPSSGAYDPNSSAWTGLSLATNQFVTITLTGTVLANATGTMTNTVTVTAANDTDTASDTDILTPQADLAVSKDDGKTDVVPGTVDTYTITVTNNGPSTVSSFSLIDTLPAELLSTAFGAPSAGSYDPNTGLWTGLSLMTGQSVSITLSGTVDPVVSGSMTNRVTVAPPTGVTDTNQNNNEAIDTDTVTPQVDVGVTKDDLVTTVVAGTGTTYTIVVTNTGPSTALNVAVSDPLPAGVSSFAWSGSNGSSGSGALSDTIATLATNETVTYTVTANIDPAATGSIDNLVTVTANNDTDLTNNFANDVDTVSQKVDVGVSKDDFASSVIPGASTTYTITVTNAGPSTATNVSVSDPLPAGVTSFNWSGSNGSSGAGALSDTIASLAPGAIVTYSIVAAIDPAATASIVNVVSVGAANDSNTANNTATDTDTLSPQADLTVTKDDFTPGAVPGLPLTYMLTVINNGPSTVFSLSLVDNLPPTLLNPVFGTPSAGIYDGITHVWSGLTLGPGESVTIPLTVMVDPAATGLLTNSVTVAPPAGVVDTDLTNNTATHTVTLTPLVDVGVTKDDFVASVVPGSATTYTITVTNTGPSTATNVSVNDPLPGGVTTFSWSGNGHSNIAAPLSDIITSLPPGGTITYTLTATIDPSATAPIINNVTVSAANDTNSGNDAAADTDTLIPQVDVGVTKTDGVTTVVAGTSTTYTIVVTNSGPSTATNVQVFDPLPAGITSFSWSGTNGHSGSGALADTIASLLPGASVTYTIIADVNSADTADIVNQVSVTAANDVNPQNDSASDTDTVTLAVDINVTKDDGVTSVVPGTSTTYTIVVSNSGPSTASNVQVSDSLPAGVTAFNWSGTNGSAGTGALTDTIASLAPGASVTYTIVADIDAAATADLVNLVNAIAANDTNPGNNSASDSDTLTPQVDVGVTKTDGVTSVVAGSSTTYTIVVTNNGPSTATNITVSDPLPAGVTTFTWSGTNGHSGSGPLNDTIFSLAPGASISYTVIATVSPAATGSLNNIVTVTVANDTNAQNNSATDTDAITPLADLGVRKGSSASVVPLGGKVVFTIKVTNLGPSTVTGFKLTDILPVGFTPSRYKTSAGTYDRTTGDWTGLSLAKGKSVVLRIAGHVSSTLIGWIVNRVRVDPAQGFVDTNMANNFASAAVYVAPPSKRWYFF